ncbi:MAG: hypothetical protein M3018_03245 [Actinomycetota bacterium]|nr:hypothetical protein [Actinomycetota bacterium]
MLEQTLEAPRVAVPDRPPPAGPERRRAGTDLLIRHRWLLGAIGLLIVSLGVVLWGGTRPGYDPYGWLVWGKLTVHFNLDTNGAPAWKPLPFLFTVPFAVVGHYALWLWMTTAVAVSLSGPIFAWRIAFWLSEAPPERRYAAYAAGAFAAAAVLGISPVAGVGVGYTHFIFSAQSDTMIVALCLAAIDCHLCGRRRWAFWLWVLAALGRPEVWPFLGFYAIWAWRAMPSMRKWIVAGVALVPLLWFGVPALTAKSWFVAGSNSLHSPRALHNSLVIGTIQRFERLQATPIWVAAGLATIMAFLSVPVGQLRHPRAWWAALGHRQRFVLILAAFALTWLVVEIAFVLHGWPGVPRYLFEAAAVVALLAGIFVGRVILDLPRLIARAAPRLSEKRIAPRLATRLGSWGAVLVLAVLAGAMLPAAKTALRAERLDLKHERVRATEINRLSTVVKRVGVARIIACGQPDIPIGYQSVLAWYMGVKIGALYVNPAYDKLHPHSMVKLLPLSNGWVVFSSHVTAASPAACRGLHFVFRS